MHTFKEKMTKIATKGLRKRTICVINSKENLDVNNNRKG